MEEPTLKENKNQKTYQTRLFFGENNFKASTMLDKKFNEDKSTIPDEGKPKASFGKDIVKRNLIPVIFSSLLDKAIFYPVETVIIHQQNASESAKEVTKRLWKEGGIRKFYPSYTLNLITVIPLRLSVFALYDLLKEQLASTKLNPLAIKVGASLATGLAETLVFCPIDSYRTRKTLTETAKMKYHPSLMFKGFSPLFVRNSVENTICLVGSDIILEAFPKPFAKKQIAPYLAAFISGYTAQFFATPFDVIKTHKMKSPDISLKTSIKALVENHGLFRSIWLKAARGGTCSAMVIGTSRIVKEFFEKDNQEEKKHDTNFRNDRC